MIHSFRHLHFGIRHLICHMRKVKLTISNVFSPQNKDSSDRVKFRRTGGLNCNNRESFQKSSPPPPKKVNRPSDRKLKKMGVQDRNHISKMSRFRVMGKKGPKSWITPEKIFLGTSEWYQSIGLKILHICLPQKCSLVCSSHNQKNTDMVIFSICPGVTFQ